MRMDQVLDLMKKEEDDKDRISLVSISDLPKGYEGTLLYGYNFDRSTLHVYAKDGEIHALTYLGSNPSDSDVISHRKGETLSVDHCIPEKRFYMEPTQFFFAELLMSKANLPMYTQNNREVLKEGEFYELGVVRD